MTFPNPPRISPAVLLRSLNAMLLFVIGFGVLTLAGCSSKDAPIERMSASDQPTNFVEGEIVVAPELRDQLSRDGKIFIFVRKPEEGQMPIATLSGEFPVFPYSFVIGEENILFDNFAFEGEMTLHARLSKSGNPIGSPGDLEGDCTTNPVKPGQRGLRIVLDKVVTEERQSSMNRPMGGGEDYE